MDYKCAFLGLELEEAIYFKHLPGFVNEIFRNHCYIFYKVVYGIKQAGKVWYETLTMFLKISKFKYGSVDPTLFQKKVGDG